MLQIQDMQVLYWVSFLYLLDLLLCLLPVPCGCVFGLAEIWRMKKYILPFRLLVIL